MFVNNGDLIRLGRTLDTQVTENLQIVDDSEIPEELLAFSRAFNVFCPTGKGGGVDPSCSKGGVKRGRTEDTGGGRDGGGSRTATGRVKGSSRGLAGTTEGPSTTGAGQERAGEDRPAGDEAHESLNRIKGRLDRYAKVFDKKGGEGAAELMRSFKAHISEVGTEKALEALGEVKGGSSVVGKVQYEGAYDELGHTTQESKFIKSYLDKAGIFLLHQNSKINPDAPLVSGWSEKNIKQEGREGRERRPAGGSRTIPDYIPTDQTFANKLEESKALPGLESSEDIHKVVGSKVTHFTPEVISSFDKQYGKGGWIVKSYGAEAYAGYGVFFPQRIKQVQQDAKAVIVSARAELKDKGYNFVRDTKGGNIIGVGKGRDVMMFGSKAFDELPKSVQKLGRQGQQAAPSEKAMRLPMSPEESLQNNYGVSFRRDHEGVPIGITNWDGKKLDFSNPKHAKALDALGKQDGGALEHELHRAQEADEWRRKGFESDPKFMVQPAFKAVGVTEADRAYGNTWETAKEGRVHVVTDPKTGKASAIPYATMAGRGDSMPVVFHNQDTKAMEAAVEHAVNQLPASERTGQLYAPDVVKTKDGWRVLELNPSAEGGGSDWLGGNPFVIDALASHMTGRDPMHVRFIRDLLTKEGVKAAAVKGSVANMAVDQPRQPAGSPGGGQFAGAGAAGGTVRIVTLGNTKVQFSTHRTKDIDGPNLGLPNYRQKDEHSCSYVAALTVVHHFSGGKEDPTDVLKAVRPNKSWGLSRQDLQSGLKQMGVETTFKKDLTVADLRRHVEAGTPVMLTVFPKDWVADHWTVVSGFSADGSRIHLSNHPSMPIQQFKDEWFDKGEGLVCHKSSSKETENVFCATGEGGGVDPSCSSGSGKAPPGVKGQGTRDNPYRCGSDIKIAAKLLSDGHHIELQQPDQVSTLLDRLDKMARKAADAGEKAKDIDLCKVSAPQSNLFCQESLGIPRINMPQMRGLPVPGTFAADKAASGGVGKKSGKVDLSQEFIQHLKEQGIGTEETSIRASHLRASQNQIVGARVGQLINETKAGTRDLREKPIFVTRDNYIVDGHHHWAAIVGYGYGRNRDMKIPVYKLDMDIGKALDMANDFTKKAGLAPKSGTANANPTGIDQFNTPTS